MKNQNSHNKVFILGAICISIIAGVISYKIAEYNKNSNDLKNTKILGVFNISGENMGSEVQKIQNAINKANQEQPATVEDDPFVIASGDTATARFAKQVYSDYVHQEAGVSDLTVSDVAQNAISQLSSADMPRPKYGLNNILITNQTNTESIRLYGNNFAEIYLRNMSKIANNQAKYDSNLLEIAKLYENISGELLKIKVPVEISSIHLAIINNYQIESDSFKLINNQSEDPVKALLGIKAAKTAMEENDQMFINISKYLKNSGIIFSKTEVGSIWNSN